MERLFKHDTSILYLHLATATIANRCWFLGGACNVRCFTQQDALYVANLIHKDSRAGIKVVRFGINIACFPDEHAVKLVKRKIAQQWKKRLDDEG